MQRQLASRRRQLTLRAGAATRAQRDERARAAARSRSPSSDGHSAAKEALARPQRVGGALKLRASAPITGHLMRGLSSTMCSMPDAMSYHEAASASNAPATAVRATPPLAEPLRRWMERCSSRRAARAARATTRCASPPCTPCSRPTCRACPRRRPCAVLREAELPAAPHVRAAVVERVLRQRGLAAVEAPEARGRRHGLAGAARASRGWSPVTARTAPGARAATRGGAPPCCMCSTGRRARARWSRRRRPSPSAQLERPRVPGVTEVRRTG